MEQRGLLPRPRLAAEDSEPPLRDYRLILVVATASVAAWTAGALAGQTDGPTRVALIVLGAGCTGVAVGLPLLRIRRAKAAQSDTRRSWVGTNERVRLEDILHPFVHLLVALAESRAADKARLRGAAAHHAVAALAVLLPPRARVTFYAYDAGPPPRLRADQFSGRADPPTADLLAEPGNANAVRELLGTHRLTYCPDTGRDRPGIWWDDTHAYRTYLIAPVESAGATLGLLTVDALQPGELAHADQALIRVVADLLATALMI